MDTSINTVLTRGGLLRSPPPTFVYVVLAVWPASITFQPCEISLACFRYLKEPRLENPSRTVLLDMASETAHSMGVQYCRSLDAPLSSDEWLLYSVDQ